MPSGSLPRKQRKSPDVYMQARQKFYQDARRDADRFGRTRIAEIWKDLATKEVSIHKVTEKSKNNEANLKKQIDKLKKENAALKEELEAYHIAVEDVSFIEKKKSGKKKKAATIKKAEMLDNITNALAKDPGYLEIG